MARALVYADRYMAPSCDDCAEDATAGDFCFVCGRWFCEVCLEDRQVPCCAE